MRPRKHFRCSLAVAGISALVLLEPTRADVCRPLSDAAAAPCDLCTDRIPGPPPRGPEEPPGPVAYTITDLGTLGGSRSSAEAVNSLGDVVGRSYTSTGANHAFLWADGVMTDLGTLGGPYSWAYDINDRGQIVGTSMTADGNSHAFLYSDGVMHDLGTLGGDSSAPRGINEAGQVVGTSMTAAGRQDAFLYSDGVMHDLGTLGGMNAAALAINDAGDVVGWSYTASGVTRAFIYRDGSMQAIYGMSIARDINDAGQVVGNTSRAILYTDRVIRNLGTMGWEESQAVAINESGQIVGTLVDRWGTLIGPSESFLYTDGNMVEINDLLPAEGRPTLDAVHDINDVGQIVGMGSSGHAVLLTPIPAPGTAALLGAGCLLLAARKRRTRAL